MSPIPAPINSSDPFKVSFDSLLPSTLVRMNKLAKVPGKQTSIRPNRRGTQRFLDKKKSDLGEARYQKVLRGKMRLLDALREVFGNDYNIHEDPDKGLLNQIPRDNEKGALKVSSTDFLYYYSSLVL
jgi:hypothetical protein